MLTPTQLHEMAVLSRPHPPAKEWAAAQISDDRRKALKEPRGKPEASENRYRVAAVQRGYLMGL